MCILCERAAAQRLGLSGRDDGAVLALSTDPVPTQALISSASAAFSHQLVNRDGVMDIYLHAPGGAVQVSGGGFGPQTIQSVAIPSEDQNYIRSIVNLLDSVIDLDFNFVGDASQADVAFYYDQEIYLEGAGEALGLASGGLEGWELFVNYPAVSNDLDYRQYVNLHEWGHSLGLEHPFEASDGDVFDNNTDPWSSAYPEQTVMAYRNPSTGNWPDFFTTEDLNALIEIWGAETQLLDSANNTFKGGLYRDVISGLGGNDRLIGANGNDQINGNDGADLLLGSWGNDELFGGSGNDVLRGGKGDDWLTGGAGDDEISGDLGSDRIRISKGNDLILGFSVNEGDRLELASGVSFSLLAVDGSVQMQTMLGVTTILGISDLAAVNSAISLV